MYLTDSGSDISLIPKRLCEKVDLEIKYAICAVNGNEIPTLGIRTTQVDLGLEQKFVWNFIVTEIETPILGANFLKHFHLLPDLTRNRLVDGQSLFSVPCVSKIACQPSIHLVSKFEGIDKRVAELLKQYPEITAPPKYQENPPHDTMHYINTTGTPVYQGPYRLQPKVLEEVKEEYRNLMKIGITEISKSEWASPLVIIRRNGKTRYCGNYRRLNAQTIPDRYPIPNLSDSSSKLHGMRTFSCVDLVKAYFNIMVYPPHVKKTAVISPAGLFQYRRMSFGLKNSPSTFMRLITSVLGDLPFLFIYFDDILVFSENLTQHLEYLQILFERLTAYGLTINLEKSTFCCSSINFLGHKISQKGLESTEERVQFIKDMKKPKTIATLKITLGIFSFY